MGYSIELIRPYDLITARSVITLNPTLTVVLAPFYVSPGVLWLMGEFINDDGAQTANLQIEESWDSAGPWTISLFNQMQTIAAGEARRFSWSTESQGPYVRVTGTASGAGLSARRSFATASKETSRGSGT